MTAAKDQGPTSSDVERMRDAAEQIAWDEAERQLALFDEGKTTYGHHAAEFIAKAIRALSLSRGREGCGAGAAALPALDTPPTELEIAHAALREIGQRVDDVRAKIGVGAELDSALGFITTQCLYVLEKEGGR
ncbi:MAG: hypothetical protein K0R61_42 [Microvirga sp.]|jgi:hypothetical protein|nr:hypothetical protein [Microvirga sp.]MDF2969592.1 hypothetical protein [Microvirga sp.]